MIKESAMQSEDMRLDGNEAGGSLSEIFVPEMTASRVTCAGCNRAHPMATLLRYGQDMGLILRCPSCNTAMLRMVRVREQLHVDVSGTSFITVDAVST